MGFEGSYQKLSKEKTRHLDAYEYYFALGDKRSSNAVAKKFKVCVHTIYKWRINFKWDKRVDKRNKSIAKRVEQQVDTGIVKSKITHRQELSDNLKMIQEVIATAIDPNTGLLRINVRTPTDLTNLMQAYERLVRLDLDIIADAPPDADAPIIKLVSSLAKIVSGETKAIPEAEVVNETKDNNENNNEELKQIVQVNNKHKRNNK